MTSISSGSREGGNRSVAFWIVFAIVAAVFLVPTMVLSGCMSGPTPDEVAREWVDDNVDIAGEVLAEWIIGAGPVEPPGVAGWLAREIGGEYIEDEIHKVIEWDYSAAREVSDGWEITATASASFAEYAGFEAGLPLVLSISGSEVTGWRPDYGAAYALADIPDSVAGVVEALPDISGVLGEEDCLGAAKAAGMPDSVIGYLDKPASERNFMEKAAVESAVSMAGLSDACAESLLNR